MMDFRQLTDGWNSPDREMIDTTGLMATRCYKDTTVFLK